jgi:hypothetical protein
VAQPAMVAKIATADAKPINILLFVTSFPS